MEIAGFVVAVLAVVVAAVSALYAKGAITRADEANHTAKAALDLQARIDEREREYRDVIWGASYADRSGFTLANTGLTDAVKVTLVLHDGHGRELHRLGDIPAGGSATVPSQLAAAWMSENKRSMPIAPPSRVHWSSPLGVAEEQPMPPVTLLMLAEEGEF